MTPAVVRPLIFTDRPDVIRAELQAHGLRPRQEAVAGGWLDLAAEGGLVALHSAVGADEPTEEGETWLSFEVGDAGVAAEALRAAGLGAVVADEAYGREVRVPTPEGATLRVAEVKHDDYGFRSHGVPGTETDCGASVPPGGVVVAEVATRMPEAWTGLLTSLGLEPGSDGLSYGDRRTGVVRLVTGGGSGERVKARVRVLP